MNNSLSPIDAAESSSSNAAQAVSVRPSRKIALEIIALLFGMLVSVILVDSLFKSIICDLLAVALGCLTFADAKVAGLTKQPKLSGRVSPLFAAIAMASITLFFYPAYPGLRARFKTAEGSSRLFLAVISLGAVHLLTIGYVVFIRVMAST